jgi:V-type H+-transporting ATPase subunit a
MKLSVILGIFQMTMGICLKGLNNIYFKQTLEFVFEFIPQIIFMVILFGYMILMIFLKWSIDWSGNLDNAPSLITQLMNIFLKLGSVQGKPLWGDGSSQVLINRIILVIAFLCIPIMLFPKPLILYNEIKNKKQQQESSESERNYNMIVEDVK